MSTQEHAPNKPFWLKLDNAAKIFPGQNTSTWSNSFRISFELEERIDPDLLLRALEQIMPRFPCYKVQIRRGFFWFYLEENKNPLRVAPDIRNPLYRVKFNENRKYLFRVYYYQNRISIDCYHVLTDGHGGAVLLSTLTAAYLRLLGAQIPAGGFVLPLEQPASDTELEDAFDRFATSKAKIQRKERFVYHAHGTKLPKHTVNVTSGIMSFSAVHGITQKKGVTLTEYLSAVMLQILIEKQKKESRRQKEVSIQIPVDLRRSFGSDTLRNFTICLRIVVDPNKGEYSFDELLTQARLQLRLANDRKEHNAMITSNMRFERNPLIRAVPLAIKNLAVGIGFGLTAEQTTSSLITNLGLVKLPPQMAPYVRSCLFMPAPGKLNPSRLGVVTVNDQLVITFSNSFEESDIERAFFTHFVKQGVHVKIESNRE